MAVSPDPSIEARIIANALFDDKKYSCGGSPCIKGKMLCCFYCSDVFDCPHKSMCLKSHDIDSDEFKLENMPPECDMREETDYEDTPVLEEIEGQRYNSVYSQR